MKLYTISLLATLFSLLTSNCVQAFEVIKGEDRNPQEYKLFTHAPLDRTRSAENQFLSNLEGIGTQTFETFPVNTQGNLQLTFPGEVNSNINPVTATLGGDGFVETTNNPNPMTSTQLTNFESNWYSLTAAQQQNYQINKDIEQGLYSVSGKQYWRATAASNTSIAFNIKFDRDVAAFGFYAYDLGDYGAKLTLKLYSKGNLIKIIDNLHSISKDGKYTGSAIYVGILGEKLANGNYETFDRVEFTAVNNNSDNPQDAFAFDNMTIGTKQQIVESIAPKTIVPD